MNSRISILFIIAATGIIITPVISFIFYGPLTAVLIFLGMIVFCELLFRVSYKIKMGTKYLIQPKIPFTEIFVEPHPYLPYVNKKKFPTPKTTLASYPLNRHKNYKFGQYVTNNMGYINGTSGDRDIRMPKPEGLIRINCLGASTTGNYINLDGGVFSYPLELEKILKNRFPGKQIEVNNCGVGGRTSAEILIDFELNIIDTQPDIIVIYHGYNDLVPSLTPEFKSDYSHAKRNLGEVWPYYRMASIFPDLPLAFYNFFVIQFFGQNIRQSLLDAVSRGHADLSSGFQGLETYQRNIEHIVNLCKSNGIKVILSTYCHYMYDDVKNSKIHMKYHEGVLLENEAMRRIAKKHGVPLVDNNRIFPYEEKYFVDSVHFSPEGMQLLAENISITIIDFLKK
jgi:lysophospholipase L1-like esterase